MRLGGILVCEDIRASSANLQLCAKILNVCVSGTLSARSVMMCERGGSVTVTRHAVSAAVLVLGCNLFEDQRGSIEHSREFEIATRSKDLPFANRFSRNGRLLEEGEKAPWWPPRLPAGYQQEGTSRDSQHYERAENDDRQADGAVVRLSSMARRYTVQEPMKGSTWALERLHPARFCAARGHESDRGGQPGRQGFCRKGDCSTRGGV